MAPAQKTTVNVVFGAMTFGKEGEEQARVHDLETCAAILDVFQAHGHYEIDTARFYGGGTSEQYLGALDWKNRGLIMDTKFFSTKGKPLKAPGDPEEGTTLTMPWMRDALSTSLKLLHTEQVDLWYLHSPDRTTDLNVTLEAVATLHAEGGFRRWGLSNFMAWEVARICEICDARGWTRPSVYQGVYNALHRAIEPELLPCLRQYGIAFYNYNPLAGGYLTSRYRREDAEADMEKGSRFDPKKWQGRMYRNRYWREEYFDALDILRPVAKKHGLTEAECALRWMTHHSKLERGKGDAIIIGASSKKHLEENMVDLEKGPLPDEVVEALDAGWQRVKGISLQYWH